MKRHNALNHRQFLRTLLSATLISALVGPPPALALRNMQGVETGLEELTDRLHVPSPAPRAFRAMAPPVGVAEPSRGARGDPGGRRPKSPEWASRASAYAKEWLFLKYGRLPQKHPLNVYTREALREALGSDADRYHVEVLPEWREVNALALPDGTLLIGSALLGFVQYREELKAVLAHEATHVAREHARVERELETTVNDLRQGTDLALRRMGVRRAQEYEADLRWMFEGGQKVNVNPLGQVVFLERLHDYEKAYLSGQGPDFTHGTLQDRALNTESVFYFMDLATLSHDLGAVPEEIRRQARALPHDQIYLFQRIGTWIRGEEYARIQARRQEIVQGLPSSQMSLAVGGLWRLVDPAVHDERQQAQRNLVQILDKRVEQDLLPESQWPDPTQRGLARILYYELHAEIPYLAPATDIPKLAVLPSFAARHTADQLPMATLDGLALLVQVLSTPAFQALPLPPVSASPDGLSRRFAALALDQLQLAKSPTEAGIERYVGLMTAWSEALRRYYASRGIEAEAAGEVFSQTMQQLYRALGAQRQALIERAAAQAERTDETLRTPRTSKKTLSFEGLPEEIVDVEKSLYGLTSGQRAYDPVTYHGFLEAMGGRLREQPVEEIVRYFDMIALALDVRFRDLEVLRARELPPAQEAEVLNSLARPWAFEAYVVYRLFERIVRQWTAFQRLSPSAREGWLFRGLVRYVYSRRETGPTFARGAGGRLTLVEGSPGERVVWGAGEVTEDGEAPRESPVLAMSDQRYLHQRLGAFERVWLEPARSDAEIADLYAVLYRGSGLPFDEDEAPRKSVVSQLFVRVLARHLADIAGWQAFFDRVDHLQTLGVPVLTLMAQHPVLYGYVLSRLWPYLPQDVHTPGFDRIRDVATVVPDPFLRLRLNAYYSEAMWPTLTTYDQKLDTVFARGATGAMDLRQFQRLIEQDTRTREEFEAARQRMRQGLDQLLTVGTREMGIAAIVAELGRVSPGTSEPFLAALLATAGGDEDLKRFLYRRLLAWRLALRSTHDLPGSDQEWLQTIDAAIRQAELAEDLLFKMDEGAKYVLLRHLLTGDAGLISQRVTRAPCLKTLIDRAVVPSGDPALRSTMDEVVDALGAIEPWKPLYFAIQPLLAERIAVPPPQLSGWPRIVSAHDVAPSLEDPLRLERYVTGRQHMTLNELAQRAERYAQRPWRGEEDLLRYGNELLRSELSKRGALLVGGNGASLSPLAFVVEIAQHAGAAGVRFLQLLPQFADLSEEDRAAFSRVYDAVYGQGKLSAVALLEREWPDFWQEVARVEERVGGGSLMTVYRVTTVGGDQQVVKVLNPNLEFLLDTNMRFLEELLDQLLRRDPAKYEIARLVLADVKEWIQRDVHFTGFLETDRRFKRQNDGFTAPGFTYRIAVPESYGPESRYFMREQYVEGENLTQWEALQRQGHDMKQVVSLIVQNYVHQLRAGVAHSDVHVGNFRVTPDRRVAILDRNFYLTLSPDLQAVVNTLLNPMALLTMPADQFVDALTKTSQNTMSPSQREALTQSWTGAKDRIVNGDWQAISSFLVDLRRHGLKLPLEATLVFKNLNSLQQMSRQAGFDTLVEAYLYAPPQSGLEERPIVLDEVPLLVLAPSSFEQLSGLEEVVHALQRTGVGPRLIVLTEGMTAEEVREAVGPARAQGGRVTIVAVPRDPMASVAAQALRPGPTGHAIEIQFIPPAVLEPWVAQIRYNLGTLGAGGLEEVGQEFLEAVGLAGAA